MQNYKEKFIIDLNKIIDKKCYGIGFSLESIIIIEFGEIITNTNPKIYPKTNDYITRGEYSLRVPTAWRIEKNNKIFCTWNYYGGYYDDEENYHDYRVKNLTNLEENLIQVIKNKKVIKVYVDENTMDFYIDFEDNYRFRVFCELNHWDWKEESSELYDFSTMNDIYSIGTNDNIIHEDLKGEYIFYDDFLKSV